MFFILFLIPIEACPRKIRSQSLLYIKIGQALQSGILPFITNHIFQDMLYISESWRQLTVSLVHKTASRLRFPIQALSLTNFHFFR